jgi:phenylacetate-CoA ligase
MALKLEQIYAVAPVTLQNMAVTWKGRNLARKRYTKRYKQTLNNLMRSQWFSTLQFHQIQVVELRNLIQEVIRNVPYYSETLRKFSSRIDTIDITSLKELPFLEKTQLRSNTNYFVNPDRLKYRYREGHTSGTSGAPLVWPYDWDSEQYNLCFRDRQYRWAGITGKEKSARFSGKILLGKHNKAPYWRYNAAEKQWLFSTYHINSETLPVYYEALKKIDPAYLDGYPSALYSIARWINTHGKTGSWRPWAIITTAETVMDFQRQEIEKAFGCNLFNFYSSSEGAPFVTQCAAGRMHLNPESGIIEFLRPDGTNAEPGEEAEMVVTSFFQRTMPLIRFRIGDTGKLAENQKCPCGRQMPIIEYIGGRESDVLHTTERGRIGSAGLSTVFYKIPSRLKESQIEQVGTDSFVFRYVPLNGLLTKNEESVVIEQFKERLGSSVTIDLQVVEQIPKGPNGKSRLVIGLKKDK